MSEKIVFWRCDAKERYYHDSLTCPTLYGVKTVRSGTKEVADKEGHTEECPYCRELRIRPTRGNYFSVKTIGRAQKEPNMVRMSYAALMAVAAACLTWVICFGYFDANKDTQRQEFNAISATSENLEYGKQQYQDGYYQGKLDGYQFGEKAGYNSGLEDGKAAVDTKAEYKKGYDSGYAKGVEDGKQSIRTDLDYGRGYDSGYSTGYADGQRSVNGGISYEDEAEDRNSYIVYVTNTGTKYHRANCSYLRSSKIAKSIEDAIAEGYTACSRCNP